MKELIIFGEDSKSILWSRLNSMCKDYADIEIDFINQVRELYYIGTQEGATAQSKIRTGTHVLKGAHVVLHDFGEWYGYWLNLMNSGKLKGGMRWSSHYKNVRTEQFEIRSSDMGAFLIGCTLEGKTWFQNERWSATGSAFCFLAHGLGGFSLHKLSGNLQVGRFGFSSASEKRDAEIYVSHEASRKVRGKYF